MQRSFASLNPQEILQVAITIEERNAGIYHRFAEMFTEFGDEESLEIAAVFWDMAIEERNHRALLQQAYRDHYGEAGCSLTEGDLIESIEVPRLDLDAVLEGGDYSLTARQRALRVALQAEHSAQTFYDEMTKRTPDGALRRLYSELAQMEDDHVAFLEAKLAQDTTESPTLQ
ncbi:MAG TPA: ferritin family protein [Terriglobales bacterium]|nr:ferritin family protein [Terriglobales bacterium]